MQECPDADLTWSESSSAQDVKIVETSPGSDKDIDAYLAAAQCTKNIVTSPSTGGKPHFSCHLCPFTARFKCFLTRHIRAHTKEKPYRCDVCPRSFSQRAHLTRHARIHTGEKPFKCEYCPLSFGQKWNLVAHRRVHTGEMPFICNFCSRKFSSKHSLLCHISTHR